MTAAHYKGGHPPGNDLGLHYTALPPIVASCPYSDQLLVTRKFWSPGANRPSQVRLIAPQHHVILKFRKGVNVSACPSSGLARPKTGKPDKSSPGNQCPLHVDSR